MPATIEWRGRQVAGDPVPGAEQEPVERGPTHDRNSSPGTVPAAALTRATHSVIATRAYGGRTRILEMNDPAWLRFLINSEAAGPFHHPNWMQVLVDAYGYQPQVLALEDGRGEVMAGLPAMRVRSRLTGERTVALPFTDHCPPLALDQAALDFLVARLADQPLGMSRHIKVHAALPVGPRIHHVNAGFRHALRLQPFDDLAKSIGRTPIGRAIRKAERSGLQVELMHSAEGVDEYYRLHCQTRRRQGLPPQPVRFFAAITERMLASGLGFVVLARQHDRAVAGALFLHWNRRLIYKYAASDPEFWPLRPNHLIIWRALQWAAASPYVELDFGKTEPGNDGLRDFKRRWGADEQSLVYSFIGAKPASPSGPRNPFPALVRHLPMAAVRAIGELLYPHVP